MPLETLAFFFHVGGAGTEGQEPGGVQYTWRVWQVALQKGVAIVALSSPGNSLSNLFTN